MTIETVKLNTLSQQDWVQVFHQDADPIRSSFITRILPQDWQQLDQQDREKIFEEAQQTLERLTGKVDNFTAAEMAIYPQLTATGFVLNKLYDIKISDQEYQQEFNKVLASRDYSNHAQNFRNAMYEKHNIAKTGKTQKLSL